MGLADADLYLDARRLADGNLGIALAITVAVEGAAAAVHGPGLWFSGRTDSPAYEIDDTVRLASDEGFTTEFALRDVPDLDGAEFQVWGDRSGNSASGWVRFLTDGRIIVARGDGATLEQPQTPAANDAAIRAALTGGPSWWRIVVPLVGWPTVEYSTDGWTTSVGPITFEAREAWGAILSGGPYASGPVGYLIGADNPTGGGRVTRGVLAALSIVGDTSGTLVDYDAARDLGTLGPVDFTDGAGSQWTNNPDNSAAAAIAPLALPSGRAVIANPAHDDPASKVTASDAAAFQIAADESAVLGFVGMIGNRTGSAPWLAVLSESVAPRIGSFRRPSNDQIRSNVNDGSTSTSTVSESFDPFEFVADLAVVDRTVSPPLLRNLLIHADGTFDERAVDITVVGAIVPTEGITALSGLPGALAALLFRNYGTGAMPSPAELAAEYAAAFAAYAAPVGPRVLSTTHRPRRLKLS